MSWLTHIKSGLAKTAKVINSRLTIILKSSKLDQTALQEIQEMLISADTGFVTARELTDKLAKANLNFNNPLDSEIKLFLHAEISARLAPFAADISLKHTPHSIILCGINGHGKTTTAGKLAVKFSHIQKKVIVAACDTFRASAVEQLALWSDRAQCQLIRGKEHQDPASVAYQAYQAAVAQKSDVLILDTAGRLHNNKNLMLELEKITRVLKKIDPSLPHDIIMVVDGSIGQNALQQVEMFMEFVSITGLIVTKLDGSAKGGFLLALTAKYQLPIYAIGIGENLEDLELLDPSEFASGMLGL